MFRYLALACDPRITSVSRAARAVVSRLHDRTAWRCVFASNQLYVACSPIACADTEVTMCHRSLVLGAVFCTPSMGDTEANLRATPAMIEAWLEAGTLFCAGWGNYVAFHEVPGAAQLQVYKAPTGSLPCLHFRHDEMHVFCSNISDARELTATAFRPNRPHVRRRLIMTEGSERPASLSNITTLIGGERLELDFATQPARLSHAQQWKPSTFTERARLIESAPQAQCALRDTVLACTRAWCERYPRLIMRLSGGLDSSIVLGAGARARPIRLISYTYFDPDGRSDERPWSRAAAAHVGTSCLEFPFSPVDVQLPQVTSFHASLEPVSTLTYLQRARLERALCTEHEAQAVFTGLGGDAGLCRDSIGLMVLDYLDQCGLRPHALPLSAQVARYTDQSFWEVAAAALRRHWFGSNSPVPSTAFAQMSRLVHPDLLRTSTVSGEPHPWLDHASLPTLRRRLGALLQPSEFYDVSVAPHDDAPQIVSPLLSQPVVEICLRIPAYMHFVDGVERGLARRAFTGEVPAAIRQRCWKDRAPGFLDRVLALHLPFVREFLLDGVMVRDGLLARPAVEAALAIQSSRSQVSAVEILNHLDTEAWLRHWQ